MKATKLLPLITVFAIVLSMAAACGAPPTEAPTEEPTEEPTEAPTEPPAEEEEEETGLGTVTIGTNAEYPPFEFVDDEGEITGFDVELMAAIADAAGFDYEFVNTRWDGIFVALASGEFDAVISAATITEEREEMVDFSDPYFNAGQRLAVRADETEIQGPDDLAGKKVGVQLGTTGDIWLTENTEAEVVRYDENTLAFQALANGDVDAAMADGPTAVDLIKANPEMDLKVLDGVYTEEQYGIAVNPERQDVLEAINEGLAAVKESGEYDEIYDEYFSTEGLAEEEEEEAGADLGTVTIGTNAEYPPFEFVDDEGNITGFDPELMAAIAEAAGFDYEFVNTRWDGIFVALASGEFDAVISAATITEEREEMVDFSDPYFNAGQRLAVRADETEIQGPDDLAGKRVGVQLGTTGDIWLTDNTEAEVVRYDENTLAFQALANGDVDAAMADGPTAVDIIKANPEMNLTVLDGVYTEEQYGIAVNPERQDVLEAINEGLAAVKESGEYDEIYNKYFGTEGEAEEEGAGADLGTVTIGTNAEYPPFEFVDDEGEITGFDVELMAALAEAAGFDYEFVNTRWDGIFVALASGEFDAVISAATITEEREEMVDFSDPYFNAGQRLAVRADETEIQGPDDLAGKKVGVQLGTTGDIWLTDNTEAEVVRYDENTLAFQALANGDVDAAMADGPTAVDIVKANPEMDLTVLDGVYTEEQYGIAVNPERQDVLEAINEGLAAVKESGKYDEIYDKYFGTE